ncbi:MAG TPA: PAS domain-containing protein, partial [Clostridiaceae bacterium]|nr:PAS domain-containing protein [Clostridiaceae bacterium]
LALSAAYPIFDAEGVLQGVLGTHFILSDINAFLKKIVEPKNASVFIFEKNTGEVIASTRNMPKFMAYPDKPLERVTIDQLENDLFSKAYQEYQASSKKDFVVDAEDDSHSVNIVEYQKNGLDWIVITAIPHGQFMVPIMRGFGFSLVFVLVALLVSLALLVRNSNIILKPIDHLVETAGKFSEGDFSQRAVVFKDDEIGKLSHAFNSMADKLNAHMNLSEERVKVRTSEIEKVNTELTEASARLRHTIDSIGRGFISTDRFGDVAMMNKEAEILTGWSQDDAVGMPFQDVFHVINAETGERCHNLVIRVFEDGEQVEFHCEPTLVTRDGEEISIEGIASPIQDEKGRRSGVVILFAKNKEQRIEKLRSISS